MTQEIDKSNEIVPKVFEFRNRGSVDPFSFNIKIENGKIVFAFDSFPPGYNDKYFIPSEEELKKFWDEMDKQEYGNALMIILLKMMCTHFSKNTVILYVECT